MKYKFTITNEKGEFISPKLNGSPAEHFAACVEIHIALLNRGPLCSHLESKHQQTGTATRNIISSLLPGGQTNPTLLKEFNNTFAPLITEEVIPISFISQLHEKIPPDVFLEEWGNNSIAELGKLMNTGVSDKEASISLFIQFLNKVKIPGVRCKVEKSDPSVTDKKHSEYKSETKVEDEHRLSIAYPTSADNYVKSLQSVIGKEVKRHPNGTQVSFSKEWLRTLSKYSDDRAIVEIHRELNMTDSVQEFKHKFSR